MRIRKNAKISPLLYAASSLDPGTVLQTHICQLNQSPWDVMMDFSPPSSPFFQVEGNGGWWGNGSSKDSISALERVSSSGSCRRISHPVPEVKREESDEVKGDSGGGKKAEKPVTCCKTDGKSWQCRREAVPGGSMCEHHLALLRNYASQPKKPKAEAAASVVIQEPRRRGPRLRKAASSSSSSSSSKSSNPYAIYYYTGFGPKWAKKRGERGKQCRDEEDDDEPRRAGVDRGNEIAAATLAQVEEEEEEEEFESAEEEKEEAENEDDEKEKKRARKRIKARSLKSLM